MTEALNLVAFDSRYYGYTQGPRLDRFQTLEVRPGGYSCASLGRWSDACLSPPPRPPRA